MIHLLLKSGLLRIILLILFTILLLGYTAEAKPPKYKSTRTIHRQHKGMGNRAFVFKKRTIHGKVRKYKSMWGVRGTCATYGNGVVMKPLTYKRYYYYRNKHG